jgi:flagellar hook-length control protein FliK
MVIRGPREISWSIDMPDLKLAALNIAPSPSAPPSSARSPDAQPAQDEAGASSFGDAMAQASTSHIDPPDEPSTASKGRPATSKKSLQRPDTRKAKAENPIAAKSSAKPEATDLPIDAPAANASKAHPANKAGDTSGLEQVASVLASIATPLPAAVAQVAVVPPAEAAAADTADSRDTESGPASALGQRTHPSKPSDTMQAVNTPPEHLSDTRSSNPTTPGNTRDTSGSDGSNVRRNASEAIGRNDTAAAGAQAASNTERLGPATGQAMQARDRLVEDFQQRFERALTTAISSNSTFQGSDAGAVHSAAAPAWGGLAPAGSPNSVVQIAVPTPVGVAAFTEDFSQRIALITRGRVHSAELSLTPADLGPVTVSIEVRGNEATLVFGATHEATRAAITDALPRLREMLDAQGLQLADAYVGGQAGDASQRHTDRQRERLNPTPTIDATNPAVTPIAPPATTARSTRLIDVIA